jgi:hypothetical protein
VSANIIAPDGGLDGRAAHSAAGYWSILHPARNTAGSLRTGAGVIDSVGIAPTAYRISPAHVTQSSKDPKIEPSLTTGPYFFLRTVFRFVVFLAVFFVADFVFDLALAFFTMLPS